jgi:hypothetical protein
MLVYGDCIRTVTGELRVAALLGRASAHLQFLSEWDVLGPVVVHELVHLLLPDLPHGHGVMRAGLGLEDWAAAGPRLDAHTAGRLAAAISARNAAAHVAGR